MEKKGDYVIFHLWYIVGGMVTRRKTRRLRHKRRLQKGGKNMNAVSNFPQKLSVVFNNLLRVDGGNFTMEDTKSMPTITWDKPPRTNTYYTYICYDPDSSVPSWIHMLIVNCATASLDSGVTLLEWQPPSPSKGTGKHRYIFGLYSHTYPVSMIPIKDRGSFNVPEYIESNGLVPVAGAFMKVEASG